ncbi:MAG: peptidase MA family metallohydrolase [Elusimicrobiales bacterium]
MHILFLFINLVYTQSWQRVETKHFEIYVEGNWTFPLAAMEVEKIYSILKMNLSPFAPWMIKENTKIYVFKNYDSYIKSPFKPPLWSKGLCLHKTRTVVVYYRKNIEDLGSTIIHELTHLYYEDFFIKKLKGPPIWLNEGLAVYMESLYLGDKSPWKISLKNAQKENFMSFADFIKADPTNIKSDSDIAWWYLQAYGIVRYLYTTFGKASFYRFSTDISNGKDVLKALWDIYRISDFEIFEKKWQDWLLRSKDEKEFEFKPFKAVEFKRIS